MNSKISHLEEENSRLVEANKKMENELKSTAKENVKEELEKVEARGPERPKRKNNILKEISNKTKKTPLEIPDVFFYIEKSEKIYFIICPICNKMCRSVQEFGEAKDSYRSHYRHFHAN